MSSPPPMQPLDYEPPRPPPPVFGAVRQVLACCCWSMSVLAALLVVVAIVLRQGIASGVDPRLDDWRRLVKVVSLNLGLTILSAVGGWVIWPSRAPPPPPPPQATNVTGAPTQENEA